jgi:hypothetical protein
MERDFGPAFAALVQQGAQALLVAPDPYFNSQATTLVALAARHSLPDAMEDGVLPALIGRVLVMKPAEFRQCGISVREIDADAIAPLEPVCGRHDRHFELRHRARFKGLRIGVRVPERVFGR